MTKPTARDACQFCKGEKGGVPGNENVITGLVVCDYCTVLVHKAAQAAREEERATGPCGKHPRACWVEAWMEAEDHCSACAREARAVARVVAQLERAQNQLQVVDANMAHEIAEAEARVRRELLDHLRSLTHECGVSLAKVADAIERGDKKEG